MVNTVTVNATKDNHLRSGDANHNGGEAVTLLLGFNSEPIRPILFFPLSGLPLDQPLVGATMQLAVVVSTTRHIRCTSSGQTTAGCAAVHVVNRPWGEGGGCTTSRPCATRSEASLAREGESSWNHNEFPSFWNSPGGDYDPNPIGKRSPDSEIPADQLGQERVGIIAEFPLDINEVATLIENQENYFGFIIIDDEDPGVTRFESRECLTDGHEYCFTRLVPRLVLNFHDDSGIGAICEDFSQELRLADLLGSAQISRFDALYQQELEALSPLYLGRESNVVVTATVAPAQQTRLSGTSQVQVNTEYRQCFEVPLQSEQTSKLDQSVTDFVSHMEIAINRNSFEDRLVAGGFDVIPGSLSIANVITKRDSDSGSGQPTFLIAGVSAGAGLVVASLLFLWWRRSRKLSSSSKKSTLTGTETTGQATNIPVADAILRLSTNGGSAGVQSRRLPAPTEAPSPAVDEPDYKDQGQTVEGELSVQDQGPFERSSEEEWEDDEDDSGVSV